MRGVAASGNAGKLPVSLPLARAIGASIANAPDRGELMSYANKATPAKQEGAYTWYPVAISEAHAFKGVATGEMTVPAPDGSQVKLRYERHVEEIDGNWTWIGRVVGGDQMQEAIITFGEKAVFGSIPQANGKPALSLQTRQGGVFAVQTDPSKVVSATKGHVDIMVPEAAALRSSMGAAVSQSAPVSQGATAIAQAAPPTSANTVDVAVGYTPEFATANGGESGANTRLVYLVQVGNQSFTNSDINGYLRIVRTVQVGYSNTNTNQAALSELTGSNGQSAVTIPASLAPLRTARDQYGADIAILVRKFNTPENEGCGIAWLNGANQTAITSQDAAWGYAVISDGYDQGTDGKTYYCSDETLVHEAAHLMGSAHDRDNSKTTGGALQHGRYAYSFGYKTAAAAGNFYTVMAYGDTGQVAHRIFSTPLKSICGSGGNLACGVANSEDNARSLNQTIPVVATFKNTVVPHGGKKRADFNGDGMSDIVWTNSTTQQTSRWFMQGPVRSGERADAAPAGYRVVGVGDFDGDGQSDLLWVNATNTSIVMWRPNASGDFVGTLVGSYPAGDWVIAGIADMNGDGRSDIVWSSQATRQVSRWFMNGPAFTGGQADAMPAGYRIVGMGDFNADGRSDILWASEGNTSLVMWFPGANNQFAGAFVGSYPAGNWTVAGIGDMNGDSYADIVWSNPTTQQLSRWYMRGPAFQGGAADAAPSNSRVIGVGDFDGDGMSDVLWANNTNTNLVMWRPNSNGHFVGNLVANYPAGGWTAVMGTY